MDREEAKYLLQACRPSGKDAADPNFAEALDLAKRDQELGSWFTEQQRISQALTTKLQEIPVPTDLKTRILSGKSELPAPRKWTWGHALAAAAIILSLLTPVAWYANRFQPSGPQTFAAMRVDMGSYLSRFFVLEKQSSDLEELRTYLADSYNLVDFKVPEALAAYPGIGCQVIPWHDQEIGLICFTAKGEIVHLFILEDAVFESGLPKETPQFAQVNKWATYSWSEAPRTYLVSTLGDKDYLTDILKF